MTNRGPGVAVVGAGLMGRWHAAYAVRAGARVGAVADADAARARSLAREVSARPFASLSEALALPDIDTVHVCTPTASHAALVRQALDAGRHVLVEKPLAETEAECRSLYAAARAAGRALCAVHQFPFQRGVRRLISGRARLGDFVRIACTMHSAGGDGRDGPSRRAILREILPHAVSLFRAVRGRGADPSAWRILAADDGELSLWQRADGTALAVDISLRARPTRCEMACAGTRASGLADLFHGFSIMERGTVSRAAKVIGPFRRASKVEIAAGRNLIGRALRREPAYPGLPELIAAFYGAIRGGAPAPVPEDEVLEAAALTDRARAVQA